MRYVVMFVFAALINIIGTLDSRAIAKWDVRAMIVLSLIGEIVAWTPWFLVAYSIYTDDLVMFLPAVLGGWFGTILVTRLKPKGG